MTNFLDTGHSHVVLVCAMRKYSTAEVAKKLGMQRPHLQRAIAQGRLKPPPLVKVGGIKIRLWSDAEVERARKSLKRKKA